MLQVIEFARRGYRAAVKAVRRRRGDDLRFLLNGFPLDAWGDEEYDAWFRAHRTTEEELAAQRTSWRDFSEQPTFSFIVPLYKTPLEYLHTMVDSVLAQTYPKFQLVLVNASVEDAKLAVEVEKIRANDERVTVLELEGNLGITENTNEGLGVATGDFCCFLDHDDALEPSLLFEYVRALNKNPQIDVLYCDEDLVVYDEKRKGFKHVHPLHKPAFAPELLLCKNYIVHLMTIRRTLIDTMPRPDKRFDGAQDYNMVLNCTARARAVYGVQKILYHWRISGTSTAANPDAKPYSRKAYRLSAYSELKRRVPCGRIVASGIVNIHNIWMDTPALPVSVVMDAGTDLFSIERALECFAQTARHDKVELIVVGSRTDALVSLCDRFDACLVESGDGSILVRYNCGASACHGDYLLFADATCSFLTADPLQQLCALCGIDGVGIAAPKQLYRNGANKSYGVAVTSERIMPMYRGYEDDFPGYQCNLRAMQNVSAVALQGLCIQRELFERLGGFDESFGPEIGAAELCHRVRAEGLRLVVTPTVKLEIDETAPEHPFDIANNAPDYPEADVAAFDARWPGVRAAGDPYLNPNLDQSSNYQQLPARS